MSEIQADQVLDCKGLSCPLPVVKTKKTIERHAGRPESLLMPATDPGSVNDMTAWAKRTRATRSSRSTKAAGSGASTSRSSSNFADHSHLEGEMQTIKESEG